jgi:hypothetical protein
VSTPLYLTIGDIENVSINEGQYQARIIPRAEPVRTYDQVLHAQVTENKGFDRVWGPLTTPPLDVDDARALYEALREPGARIVDGSLVGTNVLCHPHAVEIAWTSQIAQEAQVTFSLRQANEVAGQDRQELLRVWVADANDALVDLSEWFIGGTVTASIEQFAKTANLTFMREGVTGSIAPLVANPEPISDQRRVKIECAIIDLGETPVDEDWWVEFEGRSDDIAWGGWSPQITLPCRDKAGRVQDTIIEGVERYGSADGTEPSEDVIQALYDNNLDPSETIVVVGDPDQGVNLFDQDEYVSLADPVLEVAGLNGWDFRYLPDGNDEHQPTLYEPPRTKTVPDITFALSDYFAIEDVSRSGRNVRNVIVIAVNDALTVTVEEEDPEDPESSRQIYGRKPMKLDYTDSARVQTEPQGIALGEAILQDTAFPTTSHVAQNALVRVALQDLARYPANGIHYTADQDVAVVGYTHTFTPDGPNTTSIEGSIRPRAPVSKWFKEEDRRRTRRIVAPLPPPTLGVDDLVLLFTKPDATAGYTEESTAAESLGGWISITSISLDVDGLFGPYDETQRQAGFTVYRSVGVANISSDAIPWEDVLAWLLEPVRTGLDWSIAIDPAGVVDLESETIQGAISADEETEPDATPSLTWVQPDSSTHEDRIQLGTLEQGEAVILHIRLVFAADAVSRITGDLVALRETLPSEAA